jgi:hypothetical protein
MNDNNCDIINYTCNDHSTCINNKNNSNHYNSRIRKGTR